MTSASDHIPIRLPATAAARRTSALHKQLASAEHYERARTYHTNNWLLSAAREQELAAALSAYTRYCLDIDW